MALFWLYLHGYRAVTLLGGTTSRIGDPTGRTTGRTPLNSADAFKNVAKLHYQIKSIWQNVESCGRRYGYEKEWAWRRAIINNAQWLNKTSVSEFFQRLGMFTRLGPMLARDT
jgi:tyrosyl-tRNA synthetase